ncbi:MAG: TolA protein, partial [Labilithrix sp.]|nr:TolA protein [Labilithrix sp.]
GLGTVDRVAIDRLIHPVTVRESAAVAELRHAAEVAANAERGPDGVKRPEAEEAALAARRASEAAARGDRRGANEALEDMRKATRALEAEQRDQARSLRSLRDELEGASAAAKAGAGEDGKERPGRPSATASDALAQLKKELDAKGGDKDALRKMVARLERAESAARAAAEKDSAKGAKAGKGEKEGNAGESAWSRAAAALKEAREAAARGDAEGAKRAMERAEREVAALEKAATDPSRTSAMSRMSEGASELGRAMHAAMSGDPAAGKSDRDGESGAAKQAKADGAGSSKSASKEKDTGDPSGAPGTGPGGADRTPGPEQRRLKVNGDLQARADVREGERAVSAIEGMGRGGDPRAYREIFPSYDTVVEDGLREDTVPAARRPTVRRYFSSIRPGGDDESRK